ncbi:MAG: hypothetical protein Q8O58_08590 [Gallionella sp.]|nr:hypothetical protein [Gallionella sp.]
MTLLENNQLCEPSAAIKFFFAGALRALTHISTTWRRNRMEFGLQERLSGHPRENQTSPLPIFAPFFFENGAGQAPPHYLE